MSHPILHDFPPVVNGYPLNNWAISLIKPRAATNLILNPSFEFDTTGYSSLITTLTRVSTQQRRGIYSLSVSNTPGVALNVYYLTPTLTAGVTYHFSADFKGGEGQGYIIYFATSVGAILNYRSFKGTGKWQRPSISYTPTSTATYRLYLSAYDIPTSSGDANTHNSPFYTDGWQLEADRLTTYLDGDQHGFVKNQIAYYWTGAAHASASVRIATTRSGGEEIKLRDFGFNVLSMLGLGFGGFTNLSIPNSYLGGSQYDRTIINERAFDLVGSFTAVDPQLLDRQMSDLSDILSPSAGVVQQPMILRFQRIDERSEVPLGEPADIVALFKGGLEGNRDNYYQERTSLSFEVYLPYLARLDGDVGTTLNWQNTFTGAYGVQRVDGLWQALGTGFNGAVTGIAVDTRLNRVYFVGDFTTANGITVNHVTYWDGSTFVAMDSGVQVAGLILTLAIAPNGDVWIGGNFTTVGSGASACKGLARWNVNTQTWTAFNPATTGGAQINSMTISPTGVLYFGGNFQDWNGDGAQDYISSYNGTTFVVLGASPFTSTYYPVGPCIKVSPYDEMLYVGASQIISGIAGLHRWNGSSWTTVLQTNSASSTSIRSLAFDSVGLYLGGLFTTLGGVSASCIALYNYTSVVPLGLGVNNEVASIWVRSGGELIVGGVFTSAGGLTLADRIAMWNKSTWVPLDIDLPGTPLVYGIVETPSSFYLGFSTTGTATAAITTTVTNPGSAAGYPVITLTGPGTVVQIKNYTTGDVLYFDLILNAGEVAVLDMTAGSIKFSSNFRFNLLNTVLPGSNFGFRLTPGDNIISTLITGTTDGNTSVALRFRPTYVNLEKTLYR